MILIDIKESNAGGRMLSKQLLEIKSELGFKDTKVKNLNGMPFELLASKPDITLITDDIKYASNKTKPHFCFGEVTRLTGKNSHVIYTNSRTQHFFNSGFLLQIRHLCEKALLLDNHKLPDFKFTYRPLETQAEIVELIQYLSQAGNKFLCGCDIETSNKLITCISYSFINLKKPHQPITFCIDLIGYSKGIRVNKDNLYETYIPKLALLKDLHSLPTVDYIFHNGSYDNTYLLKYCCPTKNFKWDTQHMFYSMHSLSRKSLWNVSSSINPMYKYWKEEIKGGEEDDFDSKESMMPHTIEGYKRYLRYCGLDSFYTLTNLLYQLQLVSLRYPHAVNNYSQIHRLQLVYMEMQFTEFPLDTPFLLHLIDGKAKKANRIKAEFNYLFGDIIPKFNINSVVSKQAIFYDLLKAEPVHGSKSTSEDQLSQLAKQHTLIEHFANKVKEYQHNQKFVSDFGKVLGQKSIGCKHNSMGTITSRANSKPNDFYRGRNLQNITAEVREAFVAPKDYIIFDIDYSQADVYFVASSVDPKMYRVVTDDRDTHSVHASQIFGLSYEEVLCRKKEKHGPRNCAKPISHGGNYFMTALTMYIKLLTDIGTSGLLQMADNLKLPRPSRPKEFMAMCDYALSRYRSQYHGLLQWGYRIYNEQIRNKGLITSAFNFGTIFPIYTDPQKVDEPQRQIAAFTGQAGTAGLMNRFLVNTYFNGYSKPFDGKSYEGEEGIKALSDALNTHKLIPVIQVHDSIVGFLHKDSLHLLDHILDLMEKKIEVKGQIFHVPTECDIGYYWSKRGMIGYKRNDYKDFDFNKLTPLERRYEK